MLFPLVATLSSRAKRFCMKNPAGKPPPSNSPRAEHIVAEPQYMNVVGNGLESEYPTDPYHGAQDQEVCCSTTFTNSHHRKYTKEAICQ